MMTMKDLSYLDLQKEWGSRGNKAWVTNGMAQEESYGFDRFQGFMARWENLTCGN
jgi:hypothetical protein